MNKPNIWDELRKLRLRRPRYIGIDKGKLIHTKETESIEPGVNYFILMLEQLGCVTHFSCEGHPTGFYIGFEAPYKTALKIERVGYFNVSISGKNHWRLDHDEREIRVNDGDEKFRRLYGYRMRFVFMRDAAKAWERFLGPLKKETIEKLRRSNGSGSPHKGKGRRSRK